MSLERHAATINEKIIGKDKQGKHGFKHCFPTSLFSLQWSFASRLPDS
jgi:hypothetical protein